MKNPDEESQDLNEETLIKKSFLMLKDSINKDPTVEAKTRLGTLYHLNKKLFPEENDKLD